MSAVTLAGARAKVADTLAATELKDAQAQAALASASPIATAAATASAAPPRAPVASTAPAPNVGQTAAALGATASAGGYRIGANPAAELRRFGLQPGDVIETLNGQAVGDAASDQSLVNRARESGQATVVVVRGGRRLTLNLPLR
jgi:general secretion pathway protein C